LRNVVRYGPPVIEIPLPTPELARYVAPVADGVDPVAQYIAQGEAFSRVLISFFPDDLALAGERVLDFGCGSGRFLRHLLNAGTGAVFEGCDIDEPSVSWLAGHLPPPHTVFLNDPDPPLPRPDGHYRLIYATSVFTHLTRTWSSWMCELHRLLAQGGVLIATIIGAAAGGLFGEEPWNDQRVGMLVLGPGRPWHASGPIVLHSEWWVRAHWGRAFEILSFTAGSDLGQGVVVMRKRDTPITPRQLEAIESSEPREITALVHALRRAHDESIELNTQHDAYVAAYRDEAASRQELEGRLDDVLRQLAAARAQYDDAQRVSAALRIIMRGAAERGHAVAHRIRAYGRPRRQAS
jgi:SAM-dependent methyltransferase